MTENQRLLADLSELGQRLGWPRCETTQRAMDEIERLRAREVELLNLIHVAMPYMLNAAPSQDSPIAEWVRNAIKAGGSLLAGYHAMNLAAVSASQSIGKSE